MLIVGGVLMLAWILARARLTPEQIERLTPVQGFTAIVLLVIGASWVMRGPLRPFHGPTLVAIALAGVSYGALAGGACLAFPKQMPRPIQAITGTLCLVAGALLLLFQLRVIKPL